MAKKTGGGFSFLTNRTTLHFIFFISFVYLLNLLLNADLPSIMFFGLVGLVVSFFSKNMIVVLFITLAVTVSMKLLGYLGKNSMVEDISKKLDLNVSEDFEGEKDDDREKFEGMENFEGEEEREYFEGEEDDDRENFEGEEDDDRENFEAMNGEEEEREYFEGEEEMYRGEGLEVMSKDQKENQLSIDQDLRLNSETPNPTLPLDVVLNQLRFNL